MAGIYYPFRSGRSWPNHGRRRQQANFVSQFCKRFFDSLCVQGGLVYGLVDGGNKKVGGHGGNPLLDKNTAYQANHFIARFLSPN